MSIVAAAPTRTAPFYLPVLRFIDKTFVIAGLEVRKLRHDYTEVITRAVQPALWLVLFGGVFTRIRALPSGDLPYRDFMTPGVLAQSVLFGSIFYGISVLSERDLGLVHKYLASPTPRAALVLGKAISAGVRSLAQAVIVYALSFSLGVKLSFQPLAILGVLAVLALTAALFASFSLLIACIVKTRERFMGIGQLITMPLFFASNAIYPISLMPAWLKVIAHFNPLTYVVDALRALMIVGGVSAIGLGEDFLVIFATTALLVFLGARAYPRIVT